MFVCVFVCFSSVYHSVSHGHRSTNPQNSLKVASGSVQLCITENEIKVQRHITVTGQDSGLTGLWLQV